MFDEPRWPTKITARELIARGTSEARVSVVGLVRFDEVIAARKALGMDEEMTQSWVDMHRRWMDEELGADDLVPAFARFQALRGITQLRLDCKWIGEKGMAEALGSPLLDHLEELEVAAGLHGIGGFAPIRAMRRLRRFALARPDAQDGDHRVGDELAALLADAAFPHLAEIALPRYPVGAGLLRLLDARALPALERLDLSDCHIGDDGCGALADHPGLARIRALHLELCLGFDDEGELARPGAGFARLMTSPHLALRELDLRDVPEAGGIVARSPRMVGLVDLRLTADDDDMEALIVSPNLGSLCALRLGTARISEPLLDAFGRSALLERLEHLELDNDVTVEQAGLLARRLPNLRSLSLTANDATAELLARADLPSLTDLRYRTVPMCMELDAPDTGAIADAVIAMRGAPSLKTVTTDAFSDEDKTKLKARFGSGARFASDRGYDTVFEEEDD